RRARALGHLARMTEVWRRSEDSSRAAAKIANVTGSRWQIPAQVSPPRHVPGGDESPRGNRRTRGDQSQSKSVGGNAARLIQRLASVERAFIGSARASGASRNNPMPKGLTLAMKALPRVERSLESGSAAGAIFTASQRATTMASPDAVRASGSDSERPGRARGNPGASRGGSSGTGLIEAARKASSMRGVIAPSRLSQREFARLSSDGRGPSNSGGRTGVTINSSPTVVINGSAAGGNLQRDVIGALRAHREELFDQLRRESARRERAQF